MSIMIDEGIETKEIRLSPYRAMDVTIGTDGFISMRVSDQEIEELIEFLEIKANAETMRELMEARAEIELLVGEQKIMQQAVISSSKRARDLVKSRLDIIKERNELKKELTHTILGRERLRESCIVLKKERDEAQSAAHGMNAEYMTELIDGRDEARAEIKDAKEIIYRGGIRAWQGESLSDQTVAVVDLHNDAVKKWKIAERERDEARAHSRKLADEKDRLVEDRDYFRRGYYSASEAMQKVIKERDEWKAKAADAERDSSDLDEAESAARTRLMYANDTADKWREKAEAAEDDISVLRKHCGDVQKLSVDQQFYIASLQKEISKLKNKLGEMSRTLEEYVSGYDNLNRRFCDRCNEINSVLDVLSQSGVPFLDSNGDRHSIADRIKLLAAMRDDSELTENVKMIYEAIRKIHSALGDGDN